MITAIVDWFLSNGIAAILGFASKLITDYLTEQRHETEVRENARLGEQNRQLEETVRIQHQLAEEAAKRVSEEDAVKRLEEGSA